MHGLLNVRQLRCWLFSLAFLSCQANDILAQNKDYLDAAETLWPTIKTQLAEDPSDSSFHFMLLLVRGHCERNLDCQFRTYKSLLDKFVEIRNAEAGVFVSKEMLLVARQQKDPDAEGEAHMNLYKFYIYQDYTPLALRELENALSLFEQTGNKKRILKIQAIKLRQHISFKGHDVVIAEMEALLKEAKALKDTTTIYDLHAELVELYHGMNQEEDALRHIQALEASAPAKPIPFKTYWILIFTSRMRGWIAETNKNYSEAERYLSIALKHAEVEPSPWFEADILLSLFSVKRKAGEIGTAKVYLERAHQKAEEAKLDDLLQRAYAFKSEIAEAEGRFADALEFKKKELIQESKIRNRNPKFNVQGFYAEVEKEKMAADKARNEAELKLNETKLRNYALTLILVISIGFSLGIAYIAQRKAKFKLAAQNSIIQQQADALQSLDAAKSRFFANVSHELRTPITLMLGPIQTLLQRENLTDRQSKLLQVAEKSGKDLKNLVTEILDLSKLEAGRMVLEEQPTELVPFFRRHFLQFESLAQRKQLDYSFDVGVGTGLMAKIDQAKCRQILNNLLSNAFKFTPAGGQVKAKFTVQDDMLLLEVANTGEGIPEEDLPYVFDRYFQTKQPTKPAEGGTGIGLALCQEYAHLFGGKIEMESTPGQWTICRLSFPVYTSQLPETQIVDESQDDLALCGANSNPGNSAFHAGESHAFPQKKSLPKNAPTILVVEDNPELQDYLRLILEEKYHVITANNGQDAISKLLDDNHLPIADLILSDLMMPVMDGYQLLENLKSAETTRHLPVVMLTARADVSDRLRALRLGVDDYLLKPFEEEELLVRIESLLKNQTDREDFIADNELEAADSMMSASDRKWLEEFEAYIRENLAIETLNIPLIASTFAMSESTLLRQLKRLTGLSPVRYLQEARLSEARHLLETRQYNSVAIVAAQVGYNDIRNFSRSFKNRFGKSPSDFPMG